ncbi:MAG: DNA repair protein RecN [Gammaproteobacteria bacterium RIFCSPHIGHO2_12_FULL_42_13]|nr:MAG: DNA repair protein RecN [Gammaproteobacteria bacterium RIFCSPHIGHO2_12_FULL_42_13]
MLTHIRIQNFAIVKSLSLDFHEGLHMLTGETGAGKSIWIDAIEMGLGGRADPQVIYPNEKTCDITLCFDLTQLPEAKKWLAAESLAHEDECIVRRLIEREKPSRSTINGTPVTQQQVRAFAQLVLNIHGQHQHQQLLQSEEQRLIIDRFGNHETLLTALQTHYDEWKKIEDQRYTLQQQSTTKASDLALWQYQYDELQQLAIQENEYETLFLRFQKLHHAKQFSSALQEALEYLTQEHTARALHALQHIRITDNTLDNIRSLLTTANIHLDEARDALEKYGEDSNNTETELADIEKRLAILQDTARKHHVEPNQLLTVEKTLQEKIAGLQKMDDVLLSLSTEQSIVLKRYHEIAKQLTEKRKKATLVLQQKITAGMQQLGMTGGQFEITLALRENPVHPAGQESITFRIATNPGQPLHALNHIVSGGELSRLSLLIEALTQQKKHTPTLIFDEVDTGIGGKTATLVGKLLKTLSANAQILCVTHLPQVAAQGDHHFKAEKIMKGKTTETKIYPLTQKERAHELARMLSGDSITEKSLLHAHELLTLE